jgi:GxxExxY protein
LSICIKRLDLALAKRGLEHIREAEIPITFDGVEITRRRADFVIWDDQATLILETKAASAIKPEDIEQCLLYLRNGSCASASSPTSDRFR